MKAGQPLRSARMPPSEHHVIPESDSEFSIPKLMAYVGLDPHNRRGLLPAWPLIEPEIDGLISRFYELVLANPTARNVLQQAHVSVDGLKAIQKEWIRDVFCAEFNQVYEEKQRRIGSRHVQVRLPQPFMVTGVSVLRQGLSDLMRSKLGADAGKAGALNATLEKSLDVSLAVMLKSYQEDREVVFGEKVLLENENILAMGRMSASIAHEIKNPLAGINGAVQILRDEVPEGDPRRAIMDSILEHVRRVGNTVTDLLDFARPVKVNPQEFCLNDVLESLESLTARMPDWKVDVRVSDEARNLRLWADPVRMQNVFMNLLSNVNEAAAGRARVDIRSRRCGNQVEIHVQDDGPGIPPEWQLYLFKPFVTSKVHGTGLGLSITRKIIESHGGTLAFRPSEKGAHFVITLPGVAGPS
ncbi:MAG: ATP-binding protein [Planctomycetota bacterium]